MKLTVSCLIVLFCALNVSAEDYYSQSFRAMTRVYDECNKADFGFTQCLKKKAITFIDRVARMDSLALNDGIKVTKNEGSPELEKPISENELEQTLPRGLEARDDALTNMLIDRLSTFFNSRTIQVALPKMSTEELGRGLEEGL